MRADVEQEKELLKRLQTELTTCPSMLIVRYANGVQLINSCTSFEHLSALRDGERA